MRKIVFTLALVAMTACVSQTDTTTNTTTDSTTTKIDTTNLVAKPITGVIVK